MSAGKSLEKLRHDFGLKRREVAEEADFSVNLLKAVELGWCTPSNLFCSEVTAAMVRLHTKKAAAGATATAYDQSTN